MQLTHFGHACVLIESDSERVLVDPGIFSDGYQHLTDLTAVLITHLHPDHLDPDALPALLAANPASRLVTDTGSADVVGDLDIATEARVVTAGDTVDLGELSVQVVGGEHAVIHPDLPSVANVGFVFGDGAFYHPGDSFFVPGLDVDVLGLPTGAPWLKLSEAVEFYRAVSPRVAVPIHEKVLSAPALGIHHNSFANLGPDGATLEVLDAGRARSL